MRRLAQRDLGLLDQVIRAEQHGKRLDPSQPKLQVSRSRGRARTSSAISTASGSSPIRMRVAGPHRTSWSRIWPGVVRAQSIAVVTLRAE